MTNADNANLERETRARTEQTSIDSIQNGMQVIGASGDPIGTVDAVYQGAGAGTTAPTRATAATAPPGEPSPSGYMEVTSQGVFGGGAINPQKLWIPLDLVSHVDSGAGRLAVNATKRDVQEKYTKQPEILRGA